MSHSATNWAIKVRGLKPAAKIVLWHLADYYNPEHGCFPSQERLADDCEMSRATVNRCLDKLEELGLVRREKRIDPISKQQKSTFYILNFNKTHVQDLHTETRVSNCDTGAKAVSQIDTDPCLILGKSRVSNCDTNPVIEPVIEPVRVNPASPADDLDKILYQRGKSVLGQKASGQITKLKGLVGTGKALELIDISSRKENPNEYIAAIIRNETPGRGGQTARTIQSAAEFADTILAQREATGIRY